MRLSATLNELRPFMLSGEHIYFPTVRKMVSGWCANDGPIQECLKGHKDFWKSYDINEENTQNSSKMKFCFELGKQEIKTHKQLMKYFMYCRFFHNVLRTCKRAVDFSQTNHAMPVCCRSAPIVRGWSLKFLFHNFCAE